MFIVSKKMKTLKLKNKSTLLNVQYRNYCSESNLHAFNNQKDEKFSIIGVEQGVNIYSVRKEALVCL